jgi:hypothetical protein
VDNVGREKSLEMGEALVLELETECDIPDGVVAGEAPPCDDNDNLIEVDGVESVVWRGCGKASLTAASAASGPGTKRFTEAGAESCPSGTPTVPTRLRRTVLVDTRGGGRIIPGLRNEGGVGVAAM